MISWIITIALALLVARIVWTEVKCGRKFKTNLASTNEQIESIKKHATTTYRAKFGRDPTGAFETVDMSGRTAKKT
jgi:cytochrome b